MSAELVSQLALVLVFGTILVVCVFFLSSILFGAPYVPTHQKTLQQMFARLKLSKGSVVYDLGCGTGTVMAAARKRGLAAVGYETNPVLYLVCKLRFLRDHAATVRFGNFLHTSWAEADLVYVFGVQSIVGKVEQQAKQTMKKDSWLVLLGYRLPQRKPNFALNGLVYYKF